jgi:hypothetical protein
VIHNVMAYEICHGDPINLLVVLLLLQYKTEDIKNHIMTEFACRYSNGLLGYESLNSITESHQ